MSTPQNAPQQAPQHAPVMIIGSGPAGCTAALYAARAGLKPMLIRGMQPGGQLTITTDVENYPGFVQPIQGPWLMEQMEAQAAHHGTTLITDHISKVDFTGPRHLAYGDSGQVYSADAVIISTGASAKWLGLPSEKAFSGRGVSACATCDGAFFRNQDVAVIGGGNSALEEALYLANLCRSVTLIHRRDKFRGEKVMQDRALNHPKISVRWNSEVDEFLGGPMGLEKIRLKHPDGTTSELVVTGAFIAIGHKPNTDIFADWLSRDETGYLVLPKGSVTTTIPGVFAAGDVADSIYRQAVTAAGMGCMAALDANRYLERLQHS